MSLQGVVVVMMIVVLDGGEKATRLQGVRTSLSS
jgi:hypothetical protein